MGMSLDWDLVSKLLFPIITALVVAAIGKRMENRPKVVTYMAHAAGFNLPPTQAPQLSGASDQQDSQGQPATTQPGTPGAQVNVHSIIVRNTGKKTAFNVRLGHNLRISHYVIEPPIQHESKVSDTGGLGNPCASTCSERTNYGFLFIFPAAYVASDKFVHQVRRRHSSLSKCVPDTAAAKMAGKKLCWNFLYRCFGDFSGRGGGGAVDK
ncbi:hypothetical protein GPZ74_28755 [Burkholderia pseudomallei]|uniref:hypothetical protein n=1 Tax=Burkholderia pseudomallei TaxID=28450 RepID=UPI00132AEE30|nr:hypothetical protein [Burkholderia pseudomallei]MVZ87909.1 hypothetical protein [Burkholderia pseudomallei]